MTILWQNMWVNSSSKKPYVSASPKTILLLVTVGLERMKLAWGVTCFPTSAFRRIDEMAFFCCLSLSFLPLYIYIYIFFNWCVYELWMVCLWILAPPLLYTEETLSLYLSISNALSQSLALSLSLCPNLSLCLSLSQSHTH